VEARVEAPVEGGTDGGDRGEGGGGDSGRGAAARYRALLMRRTVAAPEAAVLVLHGGREHGLNRPSRLNAPGLRMRPFVRALARATEGRRVVLAEARYRHRGWNGDRADAARDAADALAELALRTDGAPVVLVGHSMGGRAALRVAGTPGVVGTVALAPWCPPGEPVAQLAAARLVMLHAAADRITSPAESLRMAERARAEGAAVCRFVLPGGDHAMLRQAAVWHALTTRAVCGLLGLAPLPPEVSSAFALPPGSPDGLAVPAAPGEGRVRV
jgi:predicted esterase